MSMSLWWIPLAAGLGDAINPCVFTITAFLILIHAAKDYKGIVLELLYLASVITTLVLLNSGFDLMLNHAWVAVVMLIIDALLCLFFLVLASQSAKQWFAWQRHQLIGPLMGQHLISALLKQRFLNGIVVIVLGVMVGVLAMQWPPSQEFNVLCSSVFVSGKITHIFLLWLLYVIAFCWPAWIVLLMYKTGWIKPRLRPLLNTVVMLTASTLAVFLFLK